MQLHDKNLLFVQEIRELVSVHVIPRPHDEVESILPKQDSLTPDGTGEVR